MLPPNDGNWKQPHEGSTSGDERNTKQWEMAKKRFILAGLCSLPLVLPPVGRNSRKHLHRMSGNVSQPRGVGNFRCWCCRLLAETLVNICTECPQIWIIWNVNEKHVNTTVLSVPKILIVSYQSVLNIFSIFYMHKTSVLQSQNRPEPKFFASAPAPNFWGRKNHLLLNRNFPK